MCVVARHWISVSLLNRSFVSGFKGTRLGKKTYELEMTVPLGLHGDEVPILGNGKIWCKCALVFSLFSTTAWLSRRTPLHLAHIWKICGSSSWVCFGHNGSVLDNYEVFFCIAFREKSLLDWQGQPFAWGQSQKGWQRFGRRLLRSTSSTGRGSRLLQQLVGDTKSHQPRKAVSSLSSFFWRTHVLLG